jgi:hypothetical protein
MPSYVNALEQHIHDLEEELAISHKMVEDLSPYRQMMSSVHWRKEENPMGVKYIATNSVGNLIATVVIENEHSCNLTNFWCGGAIRSDYKCINDAMDAVQKFYFKTLERLDREVYRTT